MTENSEPVLIARDLSKTIKGKQIVKSVSITLQPGEVFGFLGPNGAGKTTTIRMLVGLIRPTRGSVTICGYDVQKDFERALRCVGAIVETPDLYRFLSGRENLEHFARMLGGVDAAEISRVGRLVQLEHRLDDRVGTYSLGMRQRLGIAQALLGSPRLLVLDEPANGLDPAGIREMRQLLRSLAMDRGMSVFVSSHLLAEIELMCDRVAIIHRGEVLKAGRVDELIRSRREMALRVDHPERALHIARGLGMEPASFDHSIRMEADEHQTAALISALSDGGVRVFSAEMHQPTLEEMFLEATGGQSV